MEHQECHLNGDHPDCVSQIGKTKCVSGKTRTKLSGLRHKMSGCQEGAPNKLVFRLDPPPKQEAADRKQDWPESGELSPTSEPRSPVSPPPLCWVPYGSLAVVQTSLQNSARGLPQLCPGHSEKGLCLSLGQRVKGGKVRSEGQEGPLAS